MLPSYLYKPFIPNQVLKLSHVYSEWWLWLYTVLTSELFLPAIQLVLPVFPDGPEVSQHPHELQEVDTVVVTLRKEWVHNPLTQRVDGELGDAEEIFPRQSATVILVQWCEARVQPLNLVWCDYKMKEEGYFELLLMVL